MSKRVYITPTRVYETLYEMAEEFEVTAGALSRAISDKHEFRGIPVFVAERIYLCEMKAGGWMVGAKDSRGRGIIPMDQGRKVKLSDIKTMRDITVGWFFGKVNKF